MDVSEVESVDVDLDVGAAFVENVEAEPIPVFLFQEGALQSADGKEGRFGVDTDCMGIPNRLSALDRAGLRRIFLSDLLRLAECQRGEAE
jgi:hypothetical protein